jgi:hypothetical protein
MFISNLDTFTVEAESEAFLMAICEDRCKSLKGSAEKAEKTETPNSAFDAIKSPGYPQPQSQKNESQYKKNDSSHNFILRP